MATMRAYPAILCGALAACNQIFGLNDPVAFVDAPLVVPDAMFGQCIDDRFDTLQTSVWTEIQPSVVPIQVVGGELVIDGIATDAGVAGLVTGPYGFRGGTAEVELTDSITQEFVSATLEVTINGAAFFAISRDRLGLTMVSAFGASLVTDAPVDDRFWRIHHLDPDGVRIETSIDGTTYVERLSVSLLPILDTVTISLRAEFNQIAAGDRVAFDNFKLTAFCP